MNRVRTEVDDTGMDIDIAGLLRSILMGIGALFVGVWEASLRHPWVVVLVSVVLSIGIPKAHRRRRYGYR